MKPRPTFRVPSLKVATRDEGGEGETERFIVREERYRSKKGGSQQGSYSSMSLLETLMASACFCAAAGFAAFLGVCSFSSSSACSAGSCEATVLRLFFCCWKPSWSTSAAAAEAPAGRAVAPRLSFFFADEVLGISDGVLRLRVRPDDDGLANESKLDGGGPLRGVAGAADAAAAAEASGANLLLPPPRGAALAAFLVEAALVADAFGAATGATAAALAEEAAPAFSFSNVMCGNLQFFSVHLQDPCFKKSLQIESGMITHSSGCVRLQRLRFSQ